MIKSLAILFTCLAAGELLVRLTGLPLPASVVGMLLLTVLLQLRVVKLHWVQSMSDFLVSNIGFFFVPPGVGLMLHFGVIRASFWPIVVSTVISTALVLLATAWAHQIVRRWHRK